MVQLLTTTSAMACKSWSLPAGPVSALGSCAGYDGRPGRTCSFCYALQGQYRFNNVQRAQQERLRLWREHGPSLLEVELSQCAGYFRVFDSGDFSEPLDVLNWAYLAARNQQIKFWIVSRAWRLMLVGDPQKRTRWREMFVKLARHDNVCLRFSFDERDRKSAEKARELVPGSTLAVVGEGIEYACPKQANPDGTLKHKAEANCLAAGCRACWDKTNVEQTFMLHGQKKPVDIGWTKTKREAMK
jgi:hypothetical protein